MNNEKYRATAQLSFWAQHRATAQLSFLSEKRAPAFTSNDPDKSKFDKLNRFSQVLLEKVIN